MGQHVPGLQITRTRPKPRRARGAPPRRKMYAIVSAVAHKQHELEFKKRAHNITDALRSIYEKWLPELGEKPKTLRAWETRYYQCRKKLDERDYMPSLANLARFGPDYKK